MKGSRRVAGVLLLLVGATVALSCAGSPKKDETPFMTMEEYERNKSPPPPPPDPCKEANGEPRQCTTHSDCCEGYDCSLDPDRSRVLRYCLHR